MKALFTVTAAIEMGAGLALLSRPAATATLLLGAPLEGPAALTVARVGGAGLMALAVACWFARHDSQSGDTRANNATRGLIAALLVYNIAAVGVLADAGAVLKLYGLALWPAVLLHTGLSAWCVACLRVRA